MEFFETPFLKIALVVIGFLFEKLLDYRKLWLRDKNLGDLSSNFYFKKADEYGLFLDRYIAPKNNEFYTIIIKLYHGVILDKFNLFAKAIISDDVVKGSRKNQIKKIRELHHFYAKRIIFEEENLKIPDPLFSQIRKETSTIGTITEFGIDEILQSSKFNHLTNKEFSSLVLMELRKFIMYSESHLIPVQGRLNGKYKDLVFYHDGKKYTNI